MNRQCFKPIYSFFLYFRYSSLASATPPDQQETPSDQESGKSFFTNAALIGIIVGGIALLIVSVSLIVGYVVWKRNKNDADDNEEVLDVPLENKNHI